MLNCSDLSASVERVIEYLGVPQEAPAIVASNRPPAYWPSSSGELSVQNLVVKYAPDLPSVLHGISFTVKPTEKIGIVSPSNRETFFPLTGMNFSRSEGQDQVRVFFRGFCPL